MCGAGKVGELGFLSLKGVTCKLLDCLYQKTLKYCHKVQKKRSQASITLTAYLVKELRFIFTVSNVRVPS